MKFLSLIFSLLFCFAGSIKAQSLQLHYDFRHSLDNELNPVNYPSISFEYFKNNDTANSGSFMLKFQTDLTGENGNQGQVFTQISQSLKFWDPEVFLNFNYSGGLGVTSASYGYFIYNAFGAGISSLLFLKGAWIVPGMSYRCNFFKSPSFDPQLILYFGRGFVNYRIMTSGSFTFWTENRNHGDDFTKDLEGKKFAFFGDPQIWFKIKGKLSAGTRINIYYNILQENKIKAYPTIGLKYTFPDEK